MNWVSDWVPNKHLDAEMNMDTNAPCYLTAINWDGEEPFLQFRVHGDDASQSVSANELDLRFRVAVDWERQCIGTIDRSKDGSTSVQCDSPAVSARQCERCQTKDNIAAAQMHQAHRRGRDAIGKAMVAYLTHPHRLYVAIFRDGATKVGTTRGLSGGNRLVEQGAWYARYLAQVDDGFFVRELEDSVTEKLGIGQAIDTRKKFAGHLQPLPNQELEKRLTQLAKETEKFLTKEIGAKGTLLDDQWSNPRIEDHAWINLVSYPTVINQGAHEFAIKSMVGRLAACNKTGFVENFLVDFQPLLAHPLQTGDFEIDEFVMQDSLF
ncbi:MAG: DUF2797 domain-containing protein [Acidimicrobiales bacterium]|jgi:hypothetical protein|nr:DUF2797 domain-containing protein [Acidimicrobiales bacterium]